MARVLGVAAPPAANGDVVKQLAVWLAVVVVLAGCATAMAWTWPQAAAAVAASGGEPAGLSTKYALAAAAVQQFERNQAQAETQVVPTAVLQQRLATVQVWAAGGFPHEALADIRSLDSALSQWRLLLQDGTITTADEEDSSTPGSIFLPILFYHDTPTDFDQQLDYLQENDYTVIDMRQAVVGLRGGPLPLKPVVITFDDGYENQMQAFAILKAHKMKATFYIIDGGAASNWCIGAGRKYHLASQPPGGCGDSYLTWSQIRQLDRSGLITIGGHTIDHPDLASESEDQQQYEITGGKQQLEYELGHPVYDFAYPYGDYDDTTLSLVQAAGYLTAVTTKDGLYQPAGSEWTLERVRSVYELP